MMSSIFQVSDNLQSLSVVEAPKDFVSPVSLGHFFSPVKIVYSSVLVCFKILKSLLTTSSCPVQTLQHTSKLMIDLVTLIIKGLSQYLCRFGRRFRL